MSDIVDNESQSEDQAQEPELDIQIGEQTPEAKPEVVTLTPAEFAALKAQGDSASAIQKGIEGLSSRINPTYAPPPNTANAPMQTAEEYFTEHSDDLFDKEKGAKVMAEYTKRITEREYGPIINNLSAHFAATKKELLSAKDPMFKKYEAEIEQLVKSQPQNIQLQPDVYDRAWLTVRQKHQAEIEEEGINAKVDERLNAKLKELGIDPSKPKADPRPPAYANSEARSGGSAPSAGRKTVRLPNEETKQKLEIEARKRGLDMADLLRIKGYTS
jgi:hypothetical protein